MGSNPTSSAIGYAICYESRGTHQPEAGIIVNILEMPYYLGLTLKKKYCIAAQRRLPGKVASVGNLTMGGTGKTPAVIALAREALKRGLTPCILTRGYGGKARGPCVVTLGNGPLLTVDEAGDEPFLMAKRLKSVAIVKGPDRYQAGLLLNKANFFILDDGFQHWNLHRDVDIVLIDRMKGFGNGRLVPFGPLREPVDALARAHLLVITRQDEPLRLDPSHLCSLPGAPAHLDPATLTPYVCGAVHQPASLVDSAGGIRSITTLQGEEVYAFCALGNPEAFYRTVQSLGATVLGFTSFRDHHRYKKGEVEEIVNKARKCGAGLIVCTEKDLVKITEPPSSMPLYAITVDFTVDPGFYDSIFA